MLVHVTARRVTKRADVPCETNRPGMARFDPEKGMKYMGIADLPGKWVALLQLFGARELLLVPT